MHAGEHEISAQSARALIADQMPDLAGLTLRRVGRSGTDNVLFRLGPALVARFPRLPIGEAQIAPLARWLPSLAPALRPLTLPLVGRIGQPDGTYPFSWSVGTWIAGRDAAGAPLDQISAAETLAEFARKLQSLPTIAQHPRRGESDRIDLILSGLDPYIAGFDSAAERDLLRTAVETAQQLPQFQGMAVWVHGDLHPLNLLVRRGKLTAIIDWGSMGLGDPGMDMMVAWTLFDPPARQHFRNRLTPDPRAWGRGWALALAKSIMAIPYYRQSNPVFHRVMRQTLARVLADPRA